MHITFCTWNITWNHERTPRTLFVNVRTWLAPFGSWSWKRCSISLSRPVSWLEMSQQQYRSIMDLIWSCACSVLYPAYPLLLCLELEEFLMSYFPSDINSRKMLFIIGKNHYYMDMEYESHMRAWIIEDFFKTRRITYKKDHFTITVNFWHKKGKWSKSYSIPFHFFEIWFNSS